MRADTGGRGLTTFASLFTGGGGADVGATQAGLTPLWGVEYDPAIAAVAERNLGHPVTVADVLTLDPCDFEPVDVLHASPPCPNFSVAKAGAEETDNDIALGRKVAEFVRVLRPTCFTLENVYGYRKARSFRIIVKALAKAGYQYRWWHLNAADFGVPQTRKRLILVARLDGVPQRPHATHAPAADLAPLFDDRKPWVGWYEAIEDLIPTLPDSAFAPWQLERLPAELRGTLIMEPTEMRDGGNIMMQNDPPCTIKASRHTTFRAFIVGGANTSEEQAAPGVGVSELHEPTRAVAGNADRWRAFITQEQWEQIADEYVEWDDDDVKSFIVSNAATEWSDGIFAGDEPALTVSPQTNGRARAFVVNGENGGNEWGKLRRDDNDPAYAVSSNQSTPRAFTAGRVVQMTPRALARFQSMPDWYVLPESKTLACRIIGNAVPPLLMQRVLEANQ